MALQQRIQIERHQAMLGSVHEVLVEGPSLRDRSLLFGRNLAFDRVVFQGEETLMDRYAQVEITAATALTLSGRLVSVADAPLAAGVGAGV